MSCAPFNVIQTLSHTTHHTLHPSAPGPGHEQKGKDHTGYKATNVIPDANTRNAKAEYQVQTQPEYPVHDRA